MASPALCKSLSRRLEANLIRFARPVVCMQRRHPSIVNVESAGQLNRIHVLFREYQISVDAPICFATFQAEVAGLPGVCGTNGLPAACRSRGPRRGLRGLATAGRRSGRGRVEATLRPPGVSRCRHRSCPGDEGDRVRARGPAINASSSTHSTRCKQPNDSICRWDFKLSRCRRGTRAIIPCSWN